MTSKTSSPKAIGVIPVRYGSTRLPGKPLLELCGKPIIQHVYERAKRAKLLNDVIVATDDERIFKTVAGIGGRVVMTAATAQSGSDRVADAVKNLEAEIVVNIQGDEPLIDSRMIDETVEGLIDSEDAEVSTPVKRIASVEELRNPNVVKVVLDGNNFALYFSRSVIPFRRDEGDGEAWVREHSFYKHFGLYVYRKEFLLTFTQWESSPLEQAEGLEQLRILEHGHRIKCVITEYDSISVDTADDLERVKRILMNI